MANPRILNLRKQLRRENLDGLLLTNLDHVRYVCGFTGSAGVLALTLTRADFLTDSRYTVQAKKQIRGARVTTVDGEAIGGLGQVAGLQKKHLRLAYTPSSVTVAERERIQQQLPNALLVAGDNLVKELGWVKEKTEIANIMQAVEISDTAFDHILQLVQPGVRERDLAAELEYQMTMLGSEKPAFETIVASGYRSAMPHGIASKKKIAKGDFVTFDFGATVNGYVSDITRTVVVGKATVRQKRIYGIVQRAQRAGIRKVRAGITARAVDDACRRIITRAGHGKQFGHGTGHGIGFIVHTGPRVAPRSEDRLAANNVITVEPGIYIDGWGGVRIEDDVLVTRTGGRVLNRAPKNLLEL